jgi:hypothetical protein
LKWPFLLLNHNPLGTEMWQETTKECDKGWINPQKLNGGRVSESAWDNLVLCSSTNPSQESIQDGILYIRYLDFSSQRIAMLTTEIWVHTDLERKWYVDTKAKRWPWILVSKYVQHSHLCGDSTRWLYNNLKLGISKYTQITYLMQVYYSFFEHKSKPMSPKFLVPALSTSQNPCHQVHSSSSEQFCNFK